MMSVSMKITLSPSRYSQILFSCALLLLPTACGSLGSSSVQTSSLEDSSSRPIRLRWFPIEDARSYVLQVETSDGALLFSDEVEPLGCTHAAEEGYTSGICFYDFTSKDASTELAIQLGARTQSGITEASLLRYRK